MNTPINNAAITQIKYDAHPTLARFHASDAPMRGVMGPFASGKSVAMCIEILQRSLRQAPDANGVRRTRWAIVRNTYPELRSTTIKTWEAWVPQSICKIKWSAPIEAQMLVPLPDGTTVDMFVYFLSIDRPAQVRKVLSMELTGAWINEAREVDFSIITAVKGRLGRFPPPSVAPLTWSGLIMDTNPPDDDSWWYRLAEQTQPEGWDFYRQPGALIPETDVTGRVTGYRANAAAENIRNLQEGYAYYSKMASGADPEWVKVHCCGEYGTIFDGKPVFDQVYRDQFHASPQPLGWYKGLPLFLGWDFGLTPACIVGQLSPRGQLRILREYVCTRGGIRQFATDIVIPSLRSTFPQAKLISFGDPAGGQSSQVDEVTCFQELANLGIPTVGTNTNDFLKRRDAVINYLTRVTDGEPAFLLDPSCSMLRKGFIGGYHFSRIQVAGEAKHREVANKNKFSHPHDALQYLCQGSSSPTALGREVKTIPQASTWSSVT